MNLLSPAANEDGAAAATERKHDGWLVGFVFGRSSLLLLFCAAELQIQLDTNSYVILYSGCFQSSLILDTHFRSLFGERSHRLSEVDFRLLMTSHLIHLTSSFKHCTTALEREPLAGVNRKYSCAFDKTLHKHTIIYKER